MPPAKDKTVDLHFKTNPLDNVSECKYCGQKYKGLQLARAKAHLEGKPGAGCQPCPSVPDAVKAPLVKATQDKIQKAKDKQKKEEELEALRKRKQLEGGGGSAV